jgi:DNA/RNA endonuclease G (NUC1)
MSNISPQHKDLNRKRWAEVEKLADKEAQNKAGGNRVKDLWVISGALFDETPKTIKDTGITIPSGFYKIMMRKSGYFDNQV